MITIEGQEFTGFFGADFDANKLRGLSHSGRVDWLRFRFDLVVLSPLSALIKQDNRGPYIWLCVMNLLCGAIEALASFEVAGDPMKRFADFVEKYFRSDWKQPMELHDLKPFRPATRPADHLYKYFRSGLEHSLAIEWGGLRHRDEAGATKQLENGEHSYLFERRARGAEKSLGIIPREFVADFYVAMENFFATARAWPDGSPQARAFTDRFEDVFLRCESPSP